MSACAREANRQSKRSPLACVNFSSSSTLCFGAKLIGLLQTPSYHCALPVDFADSLPRAPPDHTTQAGSILLRRFEVNPTYPEAGSTLNRRWLTDRLQNRLSVRIPHAPPA